MRTLFLTHTDLDGIGPVILSKLFNLKISDESYKFCNYDDLYDESDEKVILKLDKHYYDRIFVVDLACNRAMLNFLRDHCDILGIFDHHERTAEIANELEVRFDLDKSGTELFFDSLSQNLDDVPEIWKMFAKIITVYDLWLTDNPLRSISEDLNRLYYKALDYRRKGTYAHYQFFIDSQVRKLLDKDIIDYTFDDYEQGLIEKAKEKENKELKMARNNMQKRVDSKEHSYILYHGSAKISHVCAMLLKEEEDVDYVLNFNTYTGSTKKRINGKISARSKEDFDVTDLHNINGHKNAGAGIFNPIMLKRIWVNRGMHLKYKEDTIETI